MDSDSEDFVVVGTSLEREEASRSYRQKKPSASALATTKALPAHLQVPTDAEGRRRFHGAFEGGFSAGYHNTVGSKEGWAPSAFRSSRGDRAPANDERSRAETYMDDDEREAAQAARLEATDAFDTFGEGAMRKAQRQFAGVAGPSRERGGGGIIPGPVPGDLVVAVSHPAAQRLLRRMGWRPGKGVGRRRTNLPRKAQTEGTDEGHLKGSDPSGPSEDEQMDDASVRVEFVREDLIDDALIPNAPVAKLDRHGFGYDPFENAEEFRAMAESRRRDRDAHPRGLRAGNAPARGEAFGVGVFEDPDEDAAAFFADDKSRDDVGHFYEIPESASDSDSRSDVKPPSFEKSFREERDGVRGFVASKHTLAPTKWYPPPVVPRGFDARHAFPDENAAPAPPARVDGERTAERRATDETDETDGQTHTEDTEGGLFLSQPPPPPPPSDAQTKTFIDTTAHFVAKNGAWFETMVREKRGADARFAFLFPEKQKQNADDSREKNSRYYAWRLRTSRLELARNAGDAAAWAARTRTRAIADIAARRRPLDADDRARALGEAPLKRRAFFEKPPPGAAASVAAFGVDAAAGSFNTAGDRTRIASALSGAFTPGTVEGGGDIPDRSAGSPGALPAGLTDAASLLARRAAEREKAAARAEAERAAAAAREAAAPMVAARTSRDWAPAALLCKRFGVPDPFELGDGRARPVEAPPATGVEFQKSAICAAGSARAETSEKKRKDERNERKGKAPFWGAIDGTAVDERETLTTTTTEVMEVPPPPPISFSNVSDEAEAFLRGLFFKKQIFEDSDDEAEAERRADRAEEEASRARRAAEESAAAPPPPPPPPMPPPLPRPDAARKRARAEPDSEPEPADLSAPVDEDPSAAASRKRRKKEKRREKKKAKARRREKKAKKEKSGKKRRRSRRRGSSDSSDSSGSSSDESDDG